MLKYPVILSILISTAAFAQVRTLARTSSFQVRADGKYNVICLNGNFETATLAEIQANTVCGAAAVPMELSGIQSAQAVNNQFQVKCTDGTVGSYSAQALQAGAPCLLAGRSTIGGARASNTSLQMKANKVYLVAFETKEAKTINGFGLLLGSVSVDPQVSLGIYSIDAAGLPEKLLFESSVIDVEQSSLYSNKIAPQVLPAGNYFIAIQGNSVLNLGAHYESSSKIKVGTVDATYALKLPATINGADFKPYADRGYVPAIFAFVQ